MTTSQLLQGKINTQNKVHRMSIINTIERPYLKWLTSGEKTAEGRINTPDRRKMQVGEYIFLFNNIIENQNILGIISFKHEYRTFKEMLITEGVSNMLPFLKSEDLEQAIKIYESFPGAERIQEFGCVAIGIKIINANLNTENITEKKI